MKVKILLFIISFLLVISIGCDKSTSVPDEPDKIYSGDIIFPTYQELYNFYELGYNIIDGDIKIVQLDSLINLKYLSNVKLITGELRIAGNPNLNSIDDIANIDIKGSILLAVDKIQSIIEFQNVSSLNGDLTISCPTIYELNSFNNLDTVLGDIIIQHNDKLESINGFSSLSQCSSLIVSSNNTLRNITGFGNLKYVGKYFLIIFNNLLNNVSGFNSLEEVQSNLQIDGNDALKNLNFLLSINKIGGKIVIEDNYLITNLDGFETVVEFGYNIGSTPYIFVGNNENLLDFCGLINIFINNDNLDFYALNNRNNPTKEQVIYECQ